MAVADAAAVDAAAASLSFFFSFFYPSADGEK